ncbi:hypothetical protein [Pseudogulbenkiania sp. MAI-1]|uniref:hypothetical protein n=1 Tax=Pseudogulbenkiania sp. MAI-1 TaxID=990370 RepID=UPI0012EC7F84|nr:hypothetical protein [Pseudogulbenkiania sp. MAI-1]
MTYKLVKDSNEVNQVYIDEKITGFFAGSDMKTLVVMGKEHHCVMDGVGELLSVLSSPLKPSLSAEFSWFTVNEKQEVSGQLSLVASDADSDEVNALLEQFGFKLNRGNQGWRKSFYIVGHRYDARGFTLPEQMVPFNKDYKVVVVEETPPGFKRAKMLLTPVTLAVDGALTVGAVLLAPIALVVLSQIRITGWR